MDEQEALLNRLKASQAYNDHIVSQQASIIKQFDKVEDLESQVANLKSHVNTQDINHQALNQKHYDLRNEFDNSHDELVEVDKIQAEVINKINISLLELSDLTKNTNNQLLKTIKELKDDLEAFKKRWLSSMVELDANIDKFKADISQQLKDGMEENLKAIPETPPYIQDLKDTITHKMRIFELSTAQAVDKANHAEMLYKVVEKRTRQ